MPHRFGGKVALIAGADGGIEGAVVERLAEEGATVAAGVRRPDPAEPLDAAWDAIELDATDPAAPVRAVEGTVERHGDHDLLVSAAGPMPLRPLAETETEDWRITLDADLIDPFVICEVLCRGRPGAAVDLACNHALAVGADAAVYAAARGALVSPTRSVALRGVRWTILAHIIICSPNGTELGSMLMRRRPKSDRRAPNVSRSFGKPQRPSDWARAGAEQEHPRRRRQARAGAATALRRTVRSRSILRSVPSCPSHGSTPNGPRPRLEGFMHLQINGRDVAVSVDPRTSLLDLLREHLHLSGTKKGCNQGACGACTVLVDGQRILSCLALAVQYEGRSVTSVEGVAPDGALHPLQQAFIEHDGFQCGYCTPGQICSAIGMAGELERGAPSAATADLSADMATPTREELRERMSGNLCRCGAYNGIVDAIAATYAGTHAEAAE